MGGRLDHEPTRNPETSASAQSWAGYDLVRVEGRRVGRVGVKTAIPQWWSDLLSYSFCMIDCREL